MFRHNPRFEVRASDRSQFGAMRSSDMQKIKNCMDEGGLALLPSDTCYSLAALAKSRTGFDKINKILGRENQPLSIAFPNYSKVQEWVKLNPVSAKLIETYTPGPITVVCKAQEHYEKKFTNLVVRSPDSTIGVRISDSMVERDVASCTIYPITTVAVREPGTDEAVRDYHRAVSIVRNGMRNVSKTPWVAIEGNGFYAQHSTVIRTVLGLADLSLLREGHIPFKDIEATAKEAPIWSPGV